MSAPEITKEDAEAALADCRSYEEGVPVNVPPHVATLARAGASVMFPGEEDVERVAAHVANALWPAAPDARNIRVLGEDAREAARRPAPADHPLTTPCADDRAGSVAGAITTRLGPRVL